LTVQSCGNFVSQANSCFTVEQSCKVKKANYLRMIAIAEEQGLAC